MMNADDTFTGLQPAGYTADHGERSVPYFPLLLVYDAPGDDKKLVVRVNNQVRKAGEMNLAKTGGEMDASGIRGQLGKGYTLIEEAL